jgi:hypothetical protein
MDFSLLHIPTLSANLVPKILWLNWFTNQLKIYIVLACNQLPCHRRALKTLKHSQLHTFTIPYTLSLHVHISQTYIQVQVLIPRSPFAVKSSILSKPDQGSHSHGMSSHHPIKLSHYNTPSNNKHSHKCYRSLRVTVYTELGVWGLGKGTGRHLL